MKELIKAEIERRRNIHKADWLRDNNNPDFVASCVMEQLLDFINSLPEEPSKVWHDASEEPDDINNILLILKSGCSIVADEETLYILELVDQWAYINELKKL